MQRRGGLAQRSRGVLVELRVLRLLVVPHCQRLLDDCEGELEFADVVHLGNLALPDGQIELVHLQVVDELLQVCDLFLVVRSVCNTCLFQRS